MELAEEKKGATWLFLVENASDLNLSEMSRKCFGKSSSWLLQRLHGYEVNGKPAEFKSDEYAKIADYLEKLGNELKEKAEMIRSAE